MKIAVSSGIRNSGKTFICTNLAVTFTELGYPVTYIDCDIIKPHDRFELHPEIEKVDPFILDSKNQGNIYNGRAWSMDFRAGRSGSDSLHIVSYLVSELMKIENRSLMLFDSPSSFGLPLLEMLGKIEYCVLVIKPVDCSVKILKEIVPRCIDAGYKPGIIIKKGPFDSYMLIEYLEEQGLEVVGGIPRYDRRIKKITDAGDIVVDELPEYRNIFRQIAENILIELDIKGSKPLKKAV